MIIWDMDKIKSTLYCRLSTLQGLRRRAKVVTSTKKKKKTEGADKRTLKEKRFSIFVLIETDRRKKPELHLESVEEGDEIDVVD